jgi:hypothetical protein
MRSPRSRNRKLGQSAHHLTIASQDGRSIRTTRTGGLSTLIVLAAQITDPRALYYAREVSVLPGAKTRGEVSKRFKETNLGNVEMLLQGTPLGPGYTRRWVGILQIYELAI